MRFAMKLLALFFGVLLLANAANAESPREQLKQMVGKLQQNPDDGVLREKIIKLARTVKPAPTVPDTAVEFEGRAQFAFKNAKSNDDYLAAAREYENAVTAAPWATGYYSDLCTIYEKAGKFEDAKHNCEFSLIGLTDAAQITDIKRRIAGLKYGIEQNSPSAVAERENNRGRKFLANLEGGVWSTKVWEGSMGEGVSMYTRDSYEVRSGKLIGKHAQWYSTDHAEPTPSETDNIELKSNRVTYSKKNLDPRCNPVTVQFSEDGVTIEESYTCNDRSQNNKYLRTH